MPRLLSYGPWADQILADLRRRGLLKVEAFRAFLASRDLAVDRTLIQQWCSGATHLPVDVLPHLADHTGRPDLVLGPLAAQVDHQLVPVGDDAVPMDLPTEALRIGAAVGRLQGRVAEALDPEGDAGPGLSGEERDAVLGQVLDLVAQLHQVALALQPGRARRSA